MNQQAWRARLPKLAMGAVVLLVLIGMFFGIKGFIDGAEKPSKSKVQIISLVKPPEPKPPEEKPPEPVKQEIKEEVQVDQPNPEPQASNEPPPLGSNLGPGNDNFGMSKGNGDGRVIGGGGSRARWYANLIGDRVEQELNRDAKLLDELKTKRVTVRIWVGSSGRVERVEWDKGVLPGGTEQALREKLLTVSVTESPDGVEQPIWYRFRPRG